MVKWRLGSQPKVIPDAAFSDVTAPCRTLSSDSGMCGAPASTDKAGMIGNYTFVDGDDEISVPSSAMVTSQESNQSQRSLGGRRLSFGMKCSRVAAFEKCLTDLMEAVEDQGVAEHRADLEDTVDANKWLLIFTDPRFEQLFCHLSAPHLRGSLITAYGVIMVYSIYALYGSAVSGHNLLFLNWTTPPNAAYNLYWLGAAVSTACLLIAAWLWRHEKTRTTRWEKFAAVFFTFLIWFRCLLGNRLRVAELLGEDALAVFGTEDDGDDELLLQNSVLVVYLAMHTHIRFKLLLLPGLSMCLAYPVSTFMTRSGRESMGREIMNSVLLAMIVCFVFIGQRRIEVVRRQNLLHKVDCGIQSILLNEQQEAARRASVELLTYKKVNQKTIWSAVEKRNNHGHRFDGNIKGTPARSSQSEEAPADQPERQVSFGPHGSAAAKSEVSCPPCETEELPLPNENLSAALPDSVDTDWSAVDRAVSRIRDPSYSLKEFHEDMVAAFPELSLYTFKSSSNLPGEECCEEMLTSGRTRLEELARTFGAFYALFWLMRIDMDGKQGLCFGYDDGWNIQPVLESPPFEDVKSKRFGCMTPEEKKVNFYHVFPWAECNTLITSAGLLKAGPMSQGPDAPCVGRDRFKAMLVLTALHDVMKNEALCPTVQAVHAPFCNYRAGQVIHDHDIALDYVLTFFGSVFSSYSGLDPPSQRLVKFTQGKMGFNNGWLVQGEAPPGALFHTFKKLIAEGGAESADVAFYFAHWVTDLAGAEPTPLSGSEKFVQKFPTGVLASFFRSFPHVWQLSTMTETQVLQDYLRARWLETSALGPLPSGEDSVALMRLALHAQGRPESVRAALEALTCEDHDVLANEMARSGLPGQQYEGLTPRVGAPALLVYYAPAFLQRNGDHLGGALAVLAEVYRQSRRLFPLASKDEPEDAAQERRPSGATEGSDAAEGKKDEPDDAAREPGPSGTAEGSDAATGKKAEDSHIHTVTIRIEQLKDLLMPEIMGLQSGWLSDVEGFFLVRKGDLEAVVERKPITSVNTLMAEGASFCYLNLHSAAMLTSPFQVPIPMTSKSTGSRIDGPATPSRSRCATPRSISCLEPSARSTDMSPSRSHGGYDGPRTPSKTPSRRYTSNA